MTSASSSSAVPSNDAPISNFSNCHEGILICLQQMGELPALALTAERARKLAGDTRTFFRDVVHEHHQEEERALFEAVLASAEPGQELDQVTAITLRLTREHRQVEAGFAKLEPELKKMTKGLACDIDRAAVATLVREYRAHAAFEEAEFLPMAQRILSRNSNHMAALGLSLHVRHVASSPSPT